MDNDHVRPLKASARRRPPPLPPTGAFQRLPGTRGRCHSGTPTLAADEGGWVTSRSINGEWTVIDVLQRQTLASAASSTSSQPSLQPARMSRRRLTVVSSLDIGSAKHRRCECHRRGSSPDDHVSSARTLAHAAETSGRPPLQLPTGRLQASLSARRTCSCSSSRHRRLLKPLGWSLRHTERTPQPAARRDRSK